MRFLHQLTIFRFHATYASKGNKCNYSTRFFRRITKASQALARPAKTFFSACEGRWADTLARG
jgi:hypothetical protein